MLTIRFIDVSPFLFHGARNHSGGALLFLKVKSRANSAQPEKENFLLVAPRP